MIKMQKFDELFDNSNLPVVIKQAKTISKEECRAIYEYMKLHYPKRILEFGTQYGCSTGVFLQISKWLNLNIELHAWDIVDQIKDICVNKKDFIFHNVDITDKEEEIIKKYNPDMIFLDAHPYRMTKALMLSCLKYKIDFLVHDITINIYENLKKRTDNFKNYEIYGAWELYLLIEIFGESLLYNDFFENDCCKITCYRDKYGLAVVEMKK